MLLLTSIGSLRVRVSGVGAAREAPPGFRLAFVNNIPKMDSTLEDHAYLSRWKVRWVTTVSIFKNDYWYSRDPNLSLVYA